MVITSRLDILNWIRDVRPDVVEHGLEHTLVDAVQAHADRPAWGTDWSEWLGANVPALVERCEADPDYVDVLGARCKRVALADQCGRECAAGLLSVVPINTVDDDDNWLVNEADPLPGDYELLRTRVERPDGFEQHVFVMAYRETLATAIRESGRDR